MRAGGNNQQRALARIGGGVLFVAFCVACVYAFFTGYGLRSCGLGVDLGFVAFAIIAPIGWFKYVLPVLAGAFVAGILVPRELRRQRAKATVVGALFLAALLASLIAGYAIMRPASCGAL
jgi:hypothetical protein